MHRLLSASLYCAAINNLTNPNLVKWRQQGQISNHMLPYLPQLNVQQMFPFFKAVFNAYTSLVITQFLNAGDE